MFQSKAKDSFLSLVKKLMLSVLKSTVLHGVKWHFLALTVDAHCFSALTFDSHCFSALKSDHFQRWLLMDVVFQRWLLTHVKICTVTLAFHGKSYISAGFPRKKDSKFCALALRLYYVVYKGFTYSSKKTFKLVSEFTALQIGYGQISLKSQTIHQFKILVKE